MKNVLFLCLLIVNGSYGQIYVQSGVNGSVTITPKGLQGKANPSGNSTNTALGSSALLKVNTTIEQRHNTAIGFRALFSNTTGSVNTAIGSYALSSNSTGNFNNAFGYFALNSNTSGASNVGVGGFALLNNTIGSFNTANGSSALRNNSIGDENTAFGFRALFANTNGDNNTASGYHALYNSSGFSNTAIGHSAGFSITTGSSNTFLGAYTNPSENNLTHATAIGAYANVNASYKIRIGSDSVTVIEGAVPWFTPSDRRLKQNITPSLLGLSFITRLTPMSYTYIADKTNVRRDGLIAQDVEKVMQELGVEFSGLQKSPDGTYSLAYSDFVMPLVNAVKEQQTKIDKLEKQVEALIKMVGGKQ